MARFQTIASEGAARLMRWSGVCHALRRAHHRSHATILFYHDPTPDVLDAHLAWLGERFHFTTLERVVDAVNVRDWSGMPEGALVVTLDDGHRGNHALLPVFQRHGVRPTIYLCSQIVATRRRFWFLQPGWRPGRKAEPYKKLSHADRLHAMKRDLGFEQEREYAEAERQALSAAEIEEMASWVDFEVHTRFHPVLTQCSATEAWEEIAGAKRELERLLGRECRHFAYPNGDYLEREVEMVRRAGFASARTVDLGWTGVSSDPFRLKAFFVKDDASLDLLEALISGIPGYVKRRLRGSRGGLWPVTRPASPDADPR